MVRLGWGEDPPQPFILSLPTPGPSSECRRGQATLSVPRADGVCLSVRPWEGGCGAAGEAVGPWLWGYWSGARGAQCPGAVRPPGGGMCAARAGTGGGGGWDSFQDLTWQPFPAGRACLAPFFPSILLRSCIPAWRPTRASPASGTALLPELPNASSCCLRLLPFPSPLWERCLKPPQHPQGFNSHRPSSALACTHSIPKNRGALHLSPGH